MAVVLAAALLAIVYSLRHATQPEEAMQGIPLLETDTGPAPEVSYLWTAGIELTGGQQQRLRDLEKRQQAELGPVLEPLEQAADEFDAALNRRTGGQTPPDADPPEEGEASRMRELSEQASSIREKYWEQAMALLTEAQREAVEEKRRREWREMLERLGLPAAPAGRQDSTPPAASDER